MKMRRCAAAALAGWLMLVLAPEARAVSAFAREGLGEWLEGYDIRGEALGSTGIGVLDPHNFCMVNPAATAFSPNTLVYFAMDGTVNHTRDGEREQRRNAGTIRGLGVHVPLTGSWGMRWTLRSATDGVYTLRETLATGSGRTDNVRISEGGRGLLRITGDATFRPTGSLAAAVSVGLTAGSLIDEVSYQFADSGWADAQYQRKLRVHPAWVLGGGLIWSPVARFAVGAATSIGTRMSAEDVLDAAGGRETRSTTTVVPPVGVGGGCSIMVHERVRLSADAYWRGWQDVQIGGLDLPQPRLGPYRDTLRWGVGLERTPYRGPAGNIWNRISWRAGWAWIPWYAEDRAGRAADELRVSLGAGIPIRIDRGTLDIAVSWGRRGSLEETGIAEEYLRVAFGTTFARMLREY